MLAQISGIVSLVAKRRAVVGNGLYVICGQIVGRGTSVLLSLILARVLTIPQFAVYNYFSVTSALLASYFAFGLQFAVAKVVAEGNAGRSWREDGRIGAILVVVAAVLVAALALSPLYLRLLLPDNIALPGILLVMGGLVMSWLSNAQAGMYAHGAFRRAFWPVLWSTAALVPISVVAILRRDVDLLIGGIILTALIPTIAYVRHLVQAGILGWHSAGRSSWGSVGAVLGISLPGLGIAGIFVTTNWLISRTLVEHQVNPQEFNKFMLGMQWFSLVLFIPLAFGQVLFPRFLQRAHGSTLAVREAVIPAALTFGMILAAAVVASFLTPLLPVFYGARYDFTHMFVFVILIAAAFAGATNLLGSYVMAVHGTGTWFLVNLAAAGLTILFLFAAPPASALAAAVLLCAIYSVLAALACAVIWRGKKPRPLPGVVLADRLEDQDPLVRGV